MKILPATLVAALVLSATCAFANQAKFQGMLRKYAVDIDAVPTLAASLQKAKTPCICFDVSFRNELGYLISHFNAADGRYEAGCYMPAFAADGALATVFTCSDYRPLGK
ncbi:MAG: hypothetical protein AB1689_20435 [Thermodesulfobacteriota bacterium]